jgi:lysophospholipase L1-like esterase
MKRRQLGVSLWRWLAVIGLIITTSAATIASQEQSVEVDPNRWNDAIAQFARWDSKNAILENPILFVGSSSIVMWKSANAFPDLPVINRGFGGSHTSEVTYFADRIVLPYKPKTIVFYAGDNDIAGGKTPQRVADDFRAFERKVHAALPETRILYIAIKPSRARWNHWPNMNQANKLINEFCKSSDKLTFVDIATPMLRKSGKSEGPPPADLFVEDGLHLSDKGYALWNETLRPVIEQKSVE